MRRRSALAPRSMLTFPSPGSAEVRVQGHVADHLKRVDVLGLPY